MCFRGMVDERYLQQLPDRTIFAYDKKLVSELHTMLS
jgi:hypothetical protein